LHTTAPILKSRPASLPAATENGYALDLISGRTDDESSELLCRAAALHLVNALYDWPNPFVTVAAPLAAAIFFVVTALWFLKLTRSGGAHRAAATPLSAAIVPAPQRARMARLLNGFSSRRWTRSAVG